MPKIRIITNDPTADMGLGVQDFDSFEAAAAAGYPQNGDRCGGDHLRVELRGQPCLVGLCGPMWGGMDGDVPIIRYEDQAAADRLSR